MKKNLIIIIIIALLTALAAYIHFSKKPKHSEAAEKQFYLDNTDAVTKIFMADKTGKKVLLQKENNKWIVNGKYKVFQPKINTLLETIRRIRVDYPVTEKQFNNVVKMLATTATKVEVYTDNKDIPAKVYYVGPETLDGLGSFAIMEIEGNTAQNPYVIHIPGFNGNVTYRYFLDEKDWRDLNVFDYNIDAIQQLSLQWFEKPEWSFTFQKQGNSFTMLENKNNAPLNVTAINQYLNSFTFLNAEALENENPQKDTVLTTEAPYLKFTLYPVGAKNPVEMVVYRMKINKRSKTQFDGLGNELKYDMDRYWAVVNNGLGFVVIQDFVFGKVIKRREDFFVKPQ